MAKPASHDTLNDDELIDETPAAPTPEAGASDWFDRNRRLVIGVVSAIAVLAAAFALYRGYYLPTQNQEALDQMVVAVRNFERDSFNLAIRGTGQYPGLEQLVADYGATEAGNLSRYYLGIAYLKTGQLDAGLAQLRAFDKGNTLVAASAYNAMAYAYEQQKEFAKAAEAYEEASAIKENGFTTPYFLSQAARAHEMGNNPRAALQAWQRIKQEYPLSPEAQNAEFEVARLEALVSN